MPDSIRLEKTTITQGQAGIGPNTFRAAEGINNNALDWTEQYRPGR